MIGIILRHHHAVPGSQVCHVLTPGQSEGTARGVLKGGDGIEKLGFVPLHQALQGLDVQAVLIARNRDDLGFKQVHRLQCTQKNGAFGQHHVAGIGQHLQQQVQPLHGTSGDQQVLLGHFHAQGIRNVRRQHIQQRGIAFRLPVLQQHLALFLQQLLRQGGHLLVRQGKAARIASREGDNIRPRTMLEQSADSAARNALHAPGEL